MFAYTLLVVVVFATAAHAFTLTMKTAPGASSTISRKIKRNIYSATSAEGLSKIYTPENDLYTFLPLTFISPRFASLPFTEPKFLTSIHFTSLRLTSLHLTSLTHSHTPPPHHHHIHHTISTLIAAVTAAGLVDALSGGLITVFAPSDG